VPVFGTDVFTYSTNFPELHVHITLHVSFSNTQHINDLRTGYSIISIFNIFYFALNLIRASALLQNIYEILLDSNLFKLKLYLNCQLILFAGEIVLGDNG
jgi:hypothetical protein